MGRYIAARGKADGASVAHAASASKVFRAYKPEAESATRKPEFKVNARLRQIEGAFRRFCRFGYMKSLDESERNGTRDIDETSYMKALGLVRRLKYTADDVAGFSIALAKFGGEREFCGQAGYFLSALVNNCHERDFCLHLGQLGIPIDHIGYMNTKNVVIHGDVGHLLGLEMGGGTIELNGNYNTGLGASLHGGKIVINASGNQNQVGNAMTGGEIHVNAPICRTGLVMGGKIFQNGRLVMGQVMR